MPYTTVVQGRVVHSDGRILAYSIHNEQEVGNGLMGRTWVCELHGVKFVASVLLHSINQSIHPKGAKAFFSTRN
jgi:hypothetical protein